MGEMSPPTAADWAQSAADRANEEIKKMKANQTDLRDQFAMAALPALIADAMAYNRDRESRGGLRNLNITMNEIASKAYVTADAMMKARR